MRNDQILLLILVSLVLQSSLEEAFLADNPQAHTEHRDEATTIPKFLVPAIVTGSSTTFMSSAPDTLVTSEGVVYKVTFPNQG